MKGDKQRCLEAGMDSYVSKPVRRKEVSAVVLEMAAKFLVAGESAAVDSNDAPASENKDSMEKIFDKSELMLECDGDTDYLRRMLEIFQRDLDERMPRLGRAVEAGDCPQIMEDAHAIKGGVGNFFAKAAFETAHQLELIGKNEQPAEAAETFRRLQSDLKALQDALNAVICE
jgi:HPt (histidine-containing phosphotransfer) domain-containing protein